MSQKPVSENEIDFRVPALSGKSRLRLKPDWSYYQDSRTLEKLCKREVESGAVHVFRWQIVSSGVPTMTFESEDEMCQNHPSTKSPVNNDGVNFFDRKCKEPRKVVVQKSASSDRRST